VILQNPGKNKIQVIKEVRVFTGLGLKDAKKLVDTAPNTVLSNAPKSTAEIAKKALEAAGATVTFQKGYKAPPRSKATSFPCDVILQNPGKNKIQVIKEVGFFTGLGLKDAKNLVDTAPNTVLTNATKSAAEKAKKVLEAAGATVTFQNR
jgi:large subunit ribosomal protein L7/L12